MMITKGVKLSRRVIYSPVIRAGIQYRATHFGDRDKHVLKIESMAGLVETDEHVYTAIPGNHIRWCTWVGLMVSSLGI
jgi:hypothetical protein